MRTFVHLAAIVGVASLVGGCSKPDAEADGVNPPSNPLGGVSIEQVGASMGTTASKQNAQNIATAAAAARAAGYLQPWTSKEEAVADVVRGITLRLGGREVSFSAGGVGISEQQEAMAFLIFDANPPGMLRFTNEPGP